MALAAILVAFLAVGRDSSGLEIGSEGGTIVSNGVSVEFPPGAVASETDVSIAPGEIDAASAYPDLESRSTAYSIDVGEPLQKPVALTLPAPGIRDGDEVLVATREAAEEAWLLLPARAGKGTVQVTTTHLSPWQAVKDTARKAAEKVTEAATNAVAAFLRLGGVRVDEPECSAPPPALRLEGDVGTGDPNALIFACLETHGDGVRLRIVNNRAVGMETLLSRGVRLTDTDSPQVSDAVLDALRSVSGRSWVAVPSTGSITVTASARNFSLEIHPTLRSFILDLAVFAVGQIGGKEGKAVESSSDFLRCTADAADAVGDGPPRNAAEAVA
ncbi:MAG TPA: hypothetical protein VLA05_10215, partial [Coriobacteriia bacterium]|nr:hypothetical protein [Coriobacteriia bacterium]